MMKNNHNVYKLSKTNITGTGITEYIVKSPVKCKVLCSAAKSECTAVKTIGLQHGRGNFQCLLYRKWWFLNGESNPLVEIAYKGKTSAIII